MNNSVTVQLIHFNLFKPLEIFAPDVFTALPGFIPIAFQKTITILYACFLVYEFQTQVLGLQLNNNHNNLDTGWY